MRQYSSFVAFENIFDTLPQSSATIYQFSQLVLKPKVTISEVDCKTKVGKLISLSPTTSGYTEVVSGLLLDHIRAQTLLSQGIYSIGVRSISTCTSKTGICQACYTGDKQSSTPNVGSVVQIIPPNTLPFLSYLANTYAGGLAGLLPLPTNELPVPALLLSSLIPDQFVSKVEREIKTYTDVPQINLDYLEHIQDKLEKSLYLLILYGLFGRN